MCVVEEGGEKEVGVGVCVRGRVVDVARVLDFDD